MMMDDDDDDDDDFDFDFEPTSLCSFSLMLRV
jgi:hypothetical protein